MVGEDQLLEVFVRDGALRDVDHRQVAISSFHHDCSSAARDDARITGPMKSRSREGRGAGYSNRER